MKSFVAMALVAALVFAGAAPAAYADDKGRTEMQKMSMDQLPAPV